MKFSKRKTGRYLHSMNMRARHHQIRKERIAQLLKERGVKFNHMKKTNEFGIDGNYLNRLINNESAGVGDIIVKQLVTFFNLPTDYFDRESLIPSENGTEKLIPLIKQSEYGRYMRGEDERKNVYVDADLYTSTTFAVQHEGDAMAELLLPYDTVVIDPDIEPSPGKIVYARIGPDRYLLREYVVESGQHILKPKNQSYPVETLTDTDQIIGIAKAVIRRL